MSTLFIIGNGFDIAHGIPSRYSDFRQFILEKYPRLREISKKQSKQDENITKINAVIDINSKNPIQATYKVFKNVGGIDSISIQEYNELIGK